MPLPHVQQTLLVVTDIPDVSAKNTVTFAHSNQSSTLVTPRDGVQATFPTPSRPTTDHRERSHSIVSPATAGESTETLDDENEEEKAQARNLASKLLEEDTQKQALVITQLNRLATSEKTKREDAQWQEARWKGIGDKYRWTYTSESHGRVANGPNQSKPEVEWQPVVHSSMKSSLYLASEFANLSNTASAFRPTTRDDAKAKKSDANHDSSETDAGNRVQATGHAAQWKKIHKQVLREAKEMARHADASEELFPRVLVHDDNTSLYSQAFSHLDEAEGNRGWNIPVAPKRLTADGMSAVPVAGASIERLAKTSVKSSLEAHMTLQDKVSPQGSPGAGGETTNFYSQRLEEWLKEAGVAKKKRGKQAAKTSARASLKTLIERGKTEGGEPNEKSVEENLWGTSADEVVYYLAANDIADKNNRKELSTAEKIVERTQELREKKKEKRSQMNNPPKEEENSRRRSRRNASVFSVSQYSSDLRQAADLGNISEDEESVDLEVLEQAREEANESRSRATKFASGGKKQLNEALHTIKDTHQHRNEFGPTESIRSLKSLPANTPFAQRQVQSRPSLETKRKKRGNSIIRSRAGSRSNSRRPTVSETVSRDGRRTAISTALSPGSAGSNQRQCRGISTLAGGLPRHQSVRSYTSIRELRGGETVGVEIHEVTTRQLDRESVLSSQTELTSDEESVAEQWAPQTNKPVWNAQGRVVKDPSDTGIPVSNPVSRQSSVEVRKSVSPTRNFRIAHEMSKEMAANDIAQSVVTTMKRRVKAEDTGGKVCYEVQQPNFREIDAEIKGGWAPPPPPPKRKSAVVSVDAEAQSPDPLSRCSTTSGTRRSSAASTSHDSPGKQRREMRRPKTTTPTSHTSSGAIQSGDALSRSVKPGVRSTVLMKRAKSQLGDLSMKFHMNHQTTLAAMDRAELQRVPRHILRQEIS